MSGGGSVVSDENQTCRVGTRPPNQQRALYQIWERDRQVCMDYVNVRHQIFYHTEKST